MMVVSRMGMMLPGTGVGVGDGVGPEVGAGVTGEGVGFEHCPGTFEKVTSI